jgi:hypothetical protein
VVEDNDEGDNRPLLSQCIEVMKNMGYWSTSFNRHECWARLLADKLKLIQPAKAEHLKVQIDTWLLQFLPENFE